MDKVKAALDRGTRIYNGLPSNLLHEIYDQLIARDDSFVNQGWWAIFSLYFARSCGVVEHKHRKRAEELACKLAAAIDLLKNDDEFVHVDVIHILNDVVCVLKGENDR